MKQNTIELIPIDMTEDVMQMLEDKGLIIRLYPGRHRLNVKKGDIFGEPIYISDEKFGSHKLITVTVDCEKSPYFGSHPDNEEFIFLGDLKSKPLYLIICCLTMDEFNKKVEDHILSRDDFAALKVRFNDPYVSFFTMLKGVIHGEATLNMDGDPPTFYVTEPSKLSVDHIDLKQYEIKIAQD